VAGLAALAFAFPFLWMLVNSLKSTTSILQDTVLFSWRSIVPTAPSFDNYRTVFGDLAFGHALLNSLVVACGQVVCSVVVATLAGYGFAARRFRGSKVLFALCMSAAFIPVEAILLPLYRLTEDMGLLSTSLGLFLPFVFHPLGMFVMQQAFSELPAEMFEAARLDGAGRFREFLRIALPNVLPGIATVVIVQFIWSSNNYLWPLVAMQDPSGQVAQVVLGSYQSVPNHPMVGEMFAASTVLTVPVVLVGVVLQRYYVRGLVSSSVK
jgi:ABC-type glycerol-3-phosphate transport system permease component